MKTWLFFFVCLSFSNAQNLQMQEQQFLDLESRYTRQWADIDSMKHKLNKLLEDIEQVKTNESQNRERIASMMSLALEQSNRIDLLQKKLLRLEKELNHKRSKLYRIYSSRIDSLKIINRNNPENQEQTESELIQLNNKRLYVSPLLTELSFDPKLVDKIKLSESHDEKEKKIYKEYLDNALNEVDSNIIYLQKKSENVREVIQLSEKAEDFMDDIEGDRFSGAFVVSEQAVNRTPGNALIEDIRNPITEINSVSKIYNRISPYIYNNVVLNDYTIQDTVYTDDYLKLLEETEKTLRLYREKIKDKLR